MASSSWAAQSETASGRCSSSKPQTKAKLRHVFAMIHGPRWDCSELVRLSPGPSGSTVRSVGQAPADSVSERRHVQYRPRLAVHSSQQQFAREEQPTVFGAEKREDPSRRWSPPTTGMTPVMAVRPPPLSYLMCTPEMARAITSRWISL